jgi:heme/copper-type cytochrome/quinol oxidase subunit 3
MTARDTVAFETLPIEASSERAPGWWAMVMLIVTELTLFGALIASYFYLRSGQPTWPPDGIKMPELTVPWIMTGVLIASSIPMFWATTGIRKDNQTALKFGLLVSFLLGAAFIGLQVYEYAHEDVVFSANSYGSLFYTITTLHGLHVCLGLLMNIFISVQAWLGYFSKRRRLAVENVALYWHFVDAVWVFLIFPSLYLLPRVLG